MKAQKFKNRCGDVFTGYYCSSCEQTFVGDYETVSVIKISGDVIEVGYYSYVNEDEYETGYTIYRCDNGCCQDDEFTMGELWQCGECEEIHSERDEAIECCQ